VPGLRRCMISIPALSDAEVAELAFQQRRAKNGSDFLPLHLQRVVVISCALRAARISRLVAGRAQAGEGEIIQRFFDGVEKAHAADRFLERRRLRSAGAALPRPDPRRHRAALLGHGRRRLRRQPRLQVEQLHQPLPHRHLDLMDLLAMYQPRANAPLDDWPS
jgi:predicted PolB exonuclease-like 3'-5' exonuclease